MDKLSNITYSVICLVVIVIIVATCALPVIESAQNQQVTEFNNSDVRYISTSSLDFVLSYDGDANAPLINGVVVPGIDPQNPTYNVYVVTDKFLVRSFIYNGVYVPWNIYSSEIMTGDVYLKSDVTVESVAGAVSVKDNADSEILSTTISTALIPSATGTYGVFNPASNRVLYSDSSAMIYYTQYGNADFYLAETVPADKNPLSAGVVFAMESGSIVTTGTKTASGTHITDNGSDYYSIVSSAGGNFSAVFAPISYHVVTDDDSMIRVLLGIIPLMLFLVPVMIATKLITPRRD